MLGDLCAGGVDRFDVRQILRRLGEALQVLCAYLSGEKGSFNRSLRGPCGEGVRGPDGDHADRVTPTRAVMLTFPDPRGDSDAEMCTSHSNGHFQPLVSRAKCTFRRGRGSTPPQNPFRRESLSSQ